MTYVKYKGPMNSSFLTNNKIYEVFSYTIGKTYIYFTIMDDNGKPGNFTMWFNDNNSFEDVSQEYSRRKTIDEILE